MFVLEVYLFMDLKKRSLCLGAVSLALLLCMNGCTSDEKSPTEPTTGPTAPQMQTGPTAVLPTSPQPGVTEFTIPVQNQQQEIITTEPAQTKPVEVDVINAQPVIDQTITTLADKLPEVLHDGTWDKGTGVELTVEPKQTEQTMVNTLVSKLEELFTTDQDTNAQITYRLSYDGYDTERSLHIFTATYSTGEQMSTDATIDAQSVVNLATESVLNSQMITVKTFNGTGYKECITITEVPDFYTTEEAAKCLADAVEREIYLQNLFDAGYTEFQIVYDSHKEANYVFLLYLK